jgi:hypothetical protein
MVWNDVILVCTLVAAMYIWFNTKAYIEYTKLFRLKSIYEPFEAAQKGPMAMMMHTYQDYLLSKYNHYFLVRLISCPDCVAVWLNLLFIVLFSSRVGGLQMFFPNLIATWFLYHVLRKVSNE